MPPKVLMVAYKFPPIRSVGALRNHHLASQLISRGYEVHVLTTTNRQLGPAQNLPAIKGIIIHEILTADYRTVLGQLPVRAANRQSGFGCSPIIRFLRKLKESAPFSLMIDEGGLLYLTLGLIRATALVRRHNIQFLTSSYRPWVDHLLAHLLCRKYPQLRWLADFRDPHVDSNRQTVVWPKIQHQIDRWMLRRAECVSTVSKGVAGQLAGLHPEIRILTNGIADWQTQPAPAPQLTESLFTIVYTGSLYPDYQTAAPLLKAIREVMDHQPETKQHIRVVYAGQHPQIWSRWIEQHQLDAISIVCGSIPYTQCLGLQQSAQLNVLLTWSGPIFSGILTGKLFEYLGAGPPILAIVNGDLPDPELESILGQYNHNLVCYAQHTPSEAIRVHLTRLIALWKNGRLLQQTIPESFKWEVMADRFFAEIDWP